ncbi:MAG: DUF2251 domain-containing protein [Bacteroidetes bacterium]|nr:DUF2251 domain-containing protein [Bacteroidota bacterium]
MKGYLLQDLTIEIGVPVIVESNASEGRYTVVFEDDGETAYFYAAERTDEPDGLRVLDALHIYNADEIAEEEKKAALKIIWSKDWLKCALVLNNYCHAVFDFSAQGGYSRNEFPPPNDIWTQGTRELTDERIKELFG